MILVVVISLSLLVFTLGSYHLFDVSADIGEANDLSGNLSYSANANNFVQRTAYWSNLTVAGLLPGGSGASTWAARGGLGPWLTESYTPISVNTSTYSYSAAPNIVFVLIDDWGYNDFGSRSTYLSWTTPTIDSLAAEGVLLTNYETSYLCSPSRSALLTGRYIIRTGVTDVNYELPDSEFLLSQELKSAGYQAYMIGKWHLGFSTLQKTPTYRGFDSFYGFFTAGETYYTKISEQYPYVDFQNNSNLIDITNLTSTHSGYLFETEAENVIKYHVANYPSKPMFLYYALQVTLKSSVIIFN
jgi:hypothetical protein